MDIYPEDFEPAYRARLQQVRGLLNGTLAGGGQYGFLGAMCGAVPGILVNLWLHIVPNMAGDFFVAGGVGAALGYAGGFFLDRDSQRKLSAKKVTTQEIALVSKGENDSLGREYIGLISELVLMQSVQDMPAEQSIRDAVRSIGSGIAGLPGQPADDLLLDAEIFKGEASCLAVEAAQESDPVVAASLRRQSVARSQRAETVSRNSSLARRSQVLRREMTEQIKALRTMVGATDLGDSGGGCDLAALAANIQQVANEARSLAEAKEEVASALGEKQSSRNGAVLERPQGQVLGGR